MDARIVCPVCTTEVADLGVLASHLVELAEESDIGHVMWLNRHVTKHRTPAAELELLVAEELGGGGSSGDRIAR